MVSTRRLSRWMQPAPEPPRVHGWLLIVAFCGALAAFVVWSEAGWMIVGIFATVATVATLVHRRRVKVLAIARAGEDIGTFARRFDHRREPFDPRVVRAVWDALRPYVTASDVSVPLRPEDQISDDLGIDWEEVEYSVLPEVTMRAGRSLENTKANPFYGRVATVGDLVHFISAQPPRDV